MMERTKHLFLILAAGHGITVYWILYNTASSLDELVLAASVVLLCAIYWFTLQPAVRQVKQVEDLVYQSSKRLSIAELDASDRSISSFLARIVGIFSTSLHYIDSIKAGNENFRTDPAFANNPLTESLASLSDHLRALAKKEQEGQWVADSMSKFIDLLKKNYPTQQAFYDHVLSHLVKFVAANQGSLYVLSEQEAEEPFLELTACYAYHRKKFIEHKVAIGEGLVGQTYLEGATVMLQEIPGDYLKITSGLGEAVPRCLFIIPFKHNEKVECIVELASFEVLPEYKIQFLERIGESIAASIVSTKLAQRTKLLLAEAQSSAEELQTQEEEMRQQMEELEATQEEMGRKEKELVKMLEHSAQQQEQLNLQLQEIVLLKEKNENFKKDVLEILNAIPAKIFLKDAEGYIVFCNNEVARAYNLSVDELIGTHDRDHFDVAQAEEFRMQEVDIMTGGPKTYVQEERLNGKLRSFQTTKMPFYIHHLDQTGLLGYQFDVTDSQRAESN